MAGSGDGAPMNAGMNAGGKCLRCGAPYEPDDTVCYHCGAPIGETQGDTAPVKIVRVNAASGGGGSLASGSGQPAEGAASSGRPPDGAASSGRPPDAPTDSGSPLPVGEGPGVRTPPEVDLSRITVGSMPAVRPAPGEARPASPGRRRSGRRMWVVAAVLVVAVVLAALGGALYARRGAPTAPPVAGQVSYADPAGRFHLLHPALWSATPTATGVSLTDSGGTSSVTVVILTPGTAGIPAGISAAAYADQLARQQGGAAPLAPLAAREVGGVLWQQREGSVTGPDGAVRETLLLVTAHAGNLYVITCISPVASFGATQNLVFDPLLGSFGFGG